jgi:TRAP-type C4-dicarboxylate transport system substrate-binding protein
MEGKHMKAFSRLSVMALAVFLAWGPAPAALAQEKTGIKLTMEEIEGGMQDTWAQFFKKQLAASLPEWNLEIYPYGVLGDAIDTLEQVMNGAVEFDMPCSHAGSVVPMIRLLAVPYIWSNNMEVNKKIMTSSKAIYEIMGRAYADHGMKLLAVFPEGWQYWSSNKPLRNMDDFKNFKIRIMNDPLLAVIYKNYGANPQTVPYGEIYTALQLKQLEGNIQPLFAHQEMGFFEQQQYFTNPFEMPFVSTVAANLKWYEGLTKAQQDAIHAAAQAASLHAIEVSDRLNTERQKMMQDKRPDLVFYQLTPAEQKAFRDKAPLVEAEFVNMAGPEAERLLKALAAEVKELEAQIK